MQEAEGMQLDAADALADEKLTDEMRLDAVDEASYVASIVDGDFEELACEGDEEDEAADITMRDVQGGTGKEQVDKWIGTRSDSNNATMYMRNGNVLAPEAERECATAKAAARANLEAYLQNVHAAPFLDLSTHTPAQLEQELADLKHDIGLQARWGREVVESGEDREGCGVARPITAQDEQQLAQLKTPCIRDLETATRGGGGRCVCPCARTCVSCVCVR
jgi:hypothetical protein